MTNKYSWFENHEAEMPFTIIHKENDVETIIAATDDAEKAHFLATAANYYTEPPFPNPEDLINGEYEPYGDEWRNEIQKLPKSLVIALAARIGKEKDEFKAKAEKWDALDKEIEKFYFDKDGNELPEEEQYNLDGIGEVAARAFKYM